MVIRCGQRDWFHYLCFIGEKTQSQHVQNHVADKYRKDLNSRPGCSLEFMILLPALENRLSLHENLCIRLFRWLFFSEESIQVNWLYRTFQRGLQRCRGWNTEFSFHISAQYGVEIFLPNLGIQNSQSAHTEEASLSIVFLREIVGLGPDPKS